MLTRAYATFHVKSVDTRQRIIEGIASTPTIDRGGDSMDPLGAKFSLPLPFLWFHRSDEPIGEVFEATPRTDGIHIKARVSRVTMPGRLKTLVDEAWAAFTANPPLVRGLSIGWSPIKEAPIPGVKNARRVSEWLWGELSAVTIPMNVEATITAIKSLDTSRGTASGPHRTTTTPGVSGFQAQGALMNASEQLTRLQADLQTKSARFAELEAADDQDGGLDAAEQTERTNLQTEIAAMTAKAQRLKTMEMAQMAIASPIATPTTRNLTPAPRTDTRIEVVNLPKGTLFTRYAMAVAAGKGSYSDTLAFAKRWEGQTPEVVAYIKAQWGQKAVEGTTTGTSPGWGAELVYPQNLVSEFVDLLRAATILGRISGTRRIPFNVRIGMQTGGSTVNWVGEGDVKPVGQLAFDSTTVPRHKVAGIVVLTEELVLDSSPAAEETVRRDMTDQVAAFIDEQLVDPTVSAGANNPASITQGVSPITASGIGMNPLLNDLNDALATFDTANMGTESVVIITTPAIARGISMLRTSIGTVDTGNGVTPQGGTLLGFPLIVSNSVQTGDIILLKANELWVADDGGVRLDASNQATLDMSGGGSPTFSLWQRNCIGMRAERFITWKKRRSDAVALISDAAYGPSVGSP